MCQTGFSGEFCQDIDIPLTCAYFNADVTCWLNKTSEKKDCPRQELTFSLDIESRPKYDCSFKLTNSCFIYYNFKIEKNRNPYVFLKKLDTNEDCPKIISWKVVTTTVFILTVLIGVGVIILYLGSSYLYDKYIYQLFLQEQQRAIFGEENPLFASSQKISSRLVLEN